MSDIVSKTENVVCDLERLEDLLCIFAEYMETEGYQSGDDVDSFKAMCFVKNISTYISLFNTAENVLHGQIEALKKITDELHLARKKAHVA